MTLHDENTSSPSTTWTWKKVKMSRPPEASTNSRPKGDYSHRLLRRNARDPLTITVTYRGGSECWWEIRARGTVLRRPGHESIHDVLSHLNGGIPQRD